MFFDKEVQPRLSKQNKTVDKKINYAKKFFCR